MIHTPNVIVNCDGCPRSFGKTTWDKSVVVEQLQAEGWIILPAKPESLERAFCPECVAKKKHEKG